ncbi:uncharacterized protein LOC131612309 [Vicia villosa]|uniref:uncharacterized protein LOC131612309 n=1 Tax=Vicia villosa TaxID=3911 RepID=UPI00273CCEE2|nr:uncharacterized protein LOC131612309 [Vicia villosa]
MTENYRFGFLEISITIKVVRDEDIEKQIGKDICFDLVALDKVKSLYASKFITFNDFKKKLATVYDIPAQFQRFWIFKQRPNLTFRPFRPMTHIEESGSIEQFNVKNKAELILFLEVKRGLDLCPIALVNLKKDDILLFFKLYDPERETLRYVGRLFVNCKDKPSNILARLNEMAGFDPDQEIELYEEIRSEPNVICEPVDVHITFNESQLVNGDIICFQKSSAVDNEKHFSIPDVPSYFKYVHNSKLPFSSFSQRIGRSKINRAEEAFVDRNAAAHQSEVDIKTTTDENSSKRNNSKIIIGDLEEIDALIKVDVIDVIDKVLSEEISISLQSQHSKQSRELDHNLSQRFLQELRDIAFKEGLVEKFKGFTQKVNFNFNAVKERSDANADAFSSWQLEHVDVIVSLLNNIVSVFDKLEDLKKGPVTAIKCTDEDNKELNKIRQKILTSIASFSKNQTELKSLDAEIADLKGKLENLQGDRVKMVEIQDQERDKITSFNKEVKSIIYRLADDKMKMKSAESNILEAKTELESHDKIYKTFTRLLGQFLHFDLCIWMIFLLAIFNLIYKIKSN